ncbi:MULTISPECIES: hypothetical protein [Devosia]|uniref:Uncharacterized protein n=1 Tax=Devosia equisanguinis TaxID=2490941 RepID=A0A3S5D360_9HYPH|nr:MULTISPECIES: hypothetical protein [Devosia]ODT48128.1 MAG: hypothetical protein ABS74_18295 [Pelagibacterium sp. SCN 63-126]ODU80688.1 MAG: hypothetical protein ABT14_18685 [Pelagibacterium sp. SCN 63-17]OJX42163.1 MAG: hypothetical protein BGO80_11555 [Devosia sp. 63-57]VDS03195.1 hypothetical protein DEVEQU_00315 [Devosia equisanguinis]
METVNPNDPARLDIIRQALSEEIDRQAQAGASRIDVMALAEAVETTLSAPVTVSEGKRPSELNATNDD